jgi:hypothetical protein
LEVRHRQRIETNGQQTGDPGFQHDAERMARDNLLALLESADDGTALAADYAEQIKTARKRLVGR